MDSILFEKEEQSYNKSLDSIAEILEIEERIQSAEERSAEDMAERRRILEHPFQSALPQKVVRVASFALDIEGTYDPTLPSKSEFDLAKDYLSAKTDEERDELVNGELTGPGLPLQWALSEVDPRKRDNVCIETLKGYGIDTTEIEREKGLVKAPELKTPELSPRDKELAHVATLSSKIESPLVTLENELAVALSLQKDNSLQMERD